MRVVTLGSFDLLHPGHLSLFDWCRKLAGKGDQFIVAVNRDEFIKAYKGAAPVMAEADRVAVVTAAAGASEVCLNCQRKPGDSAAASILAPGTNPSPTIVAIGADWRDRSYLGQLAVTQAWCDEHAVVVVYVPLLAGHSSTALRTGP